MAFLPGHNPHFLAHLSDVVIRKCLTDDIAAVGDHAAVKIRPAALVFQVRIHAGKRASHEQDLGKRKVRDRHPSIVEEKVPRDEV